MRMEEVLKIAVQCHPRCSISVGVEQWYMSHNKNWEQKKFQIGVQSDTHIHIFSGKSWVDCISQLKGYEYTESDRFGNDSKEMPF